MSGGLPDIFLFGPKGLVPMSFAPRVERTLGPYGALRPEDQLLLQLVCHAILQLRDCDIPRGQGRRRGSRTPCPDGWMIACHEEDRHFVYEARKMPGGKTVTTKKAAVSGFMFPIFDIVVGSSVAFSMREYEDGFVVEHIDTQKLDGCVDDLFEVALEHAELTFRRC